MSNRISSPASEVLTGAATALASDVGKLLTYNAAADGNITIPSDAAAGWSGNAELRVYVAGAGLPAFVGDTGVTVNNPAAAAAVQFGFLRAIRVGSDAWSVISEQSGGSGGSGTPPTSVALAGTKDGVNATFTIPDAVVPDSWCAVYLNGARLKEGVGFTRSGGTITMQAGYLPASGDTLEADYV